MIANLVFALLTAAMTLALIQLVRSSSLPERVVALDLMATLAVGFIVTYAVSTDQPVFMDVAVVLALIAFLGTVAFAYFIEKGDLPWGRS